MLVVCVWSFLLLLDEEDEFLCHYCLLLCWGIPLFCDGDREGIYEGENGA